MRSRLRRQLEPLRPLARRLGLGDISLGLAEGFLRVIVLAVPSTMLASRIPPPTPALLEQVAQVGVVLVLAYVLEAVWLVPRFSGTVNYEVRLGAVTGLGIAGMFGVVLALLTAAHIAAGHENWLDWIAIGWIAPSLVFLAGVVVIQPLLVDEWERPSEN